jgi:hypothetical protein
MCPVCITALIAGSVASTAGLAALAIKRSEKKNTADVLNVKEPELPRPSDSG